MDSINLRCSKVIIRYLRGSWCCDNCNSSHSKFQAVAIRNNLKKKADVAEEAAGLFLELPGIFKSIRNPLIPITKKQKNQKNQITIR